jgi:hypothetical protein
MGHFSGYFEGALTYFLEFACQISWWPSLFPIDSLADLLVPVGPLFQLHDGFLA